MKITIPNIDRPNIHIVYYWILQVHSISCIIEKCCCWVTATTSPNCHKARPVTNEFNFACLHIINRATQVTNNEIIAVTKRKKSIG